MKEFDFRDKKRDKEEKYKDSSKKRLLNNIKTKFNTTTIGSLAVVEDHFGHLWGHGVHPDDLTEEEKEWRETWNEARTKILDLGNSNSRGAQSEISQYSLSWNRYVTKFKVYNRSNEENYDE